MTIDEIQQKIHGAASMTCESIDSFSLSSNRVEVEIGITKN